jgi:hypothetical protein
MNIGFASIYSSRPIPHFIAYLEHLARIGGANTFALTCDGAIGTCYNHLLRNKSRFVECSMCMVGGLRSFPITRVDSIQRSVSESLPQKEAFKLAYSSAITLSRVENPEDFKGSQVNKYQDLLSYGVQAAYASARRWIDDCELDAVVLYNGRMDATAAVAQACKDMGKRFLTVERSPLIGHGIWLVPDDNCLSLRTINSMMGEFSLRPLTAEQAHLAAEFLVCRLQRRSNLEWRVYNQSAVDTGWPQKHPSKRILILPSSRNELEGHHEWDSIFTDLGNVLLRLFDEGTIKAQDCVVRGHPIWAERIGSIPTSPANKYWEEFCSKNGITYIQSESKISTQCLIKESDAVILNGSSAAIEAGACGKPVFCFGHSHYEEAGIATMIRNESEWFKMDLSRKHDSSQVIRKTLRYIYWQGWRYPQFVKYVRGMNPVSYNFISGADPGRLLNLLHSGVVNPDDTIHSFCQSIENEYVDGFLSGETERYVKNKIELPEGRNIIKRRLILRPIDSLRSLLPKGDA